MLVSIGVLSIFDALGKNIRDEDHRVTEWDYKVKLIAKSLKSINMKKTIKGSLDGICQISSIYKKRCLESLSP